MFLVNDLAGALVDGCLPAEGGGGVEQGTVRSIQGTSEILGLLRKLSPTSATPERKQKFVRARRLSRGSSSKRGGGFANSSQRR